MLVRDDVEPLGPEWSESPKSWTLCCEQHSHCLPPLKPLQQTRRPELVNQELPGQPAAGTMDPEIWTQTPLLLYQGPVHLPPRSPRPITDVEAKPITDVEAIPSQRSSKECKKVLGRNALSTEPSRYQGCRVVCAEPTPESILHWRWGQARLGALEHPAPQALPPPAFS